MDKFLTDKKILAIIPARGGSKGIPKKNIKMLCGKPLLYYTTQVAQSAKIFDRVILSTDSEEIATIGRSFDLEVPYLRPKHLAQDQTPMIDVIKQLLASLKEQAYEFDAFAILQPTSPLRKIETLVSGLQLLIEQDLDSVVTVVEVPKHYNPHFVLKINGNGFLDFFMPDGKGLTARQNCPPVYSRNGVLYAVKYHSFIKHNSFYGPKCLPLICDEQESVNIDSLDDWYLAEKLMAERQRERENNVLY